MAIATKTPALEVLMAVLVALKVLESSGVAVMVAVDQMLVAKGIQHTTRRLTHRFQFGSGRTVSSSSSSGDDTGVADTGIGPGSGNGNGRVSREAGDCVVSGWASVFILN